MFQLCSRVLTGPLANPGNTFHTHTTQSCKCVQILASVDRIPTFDEMQGLLDQNSFLHTLTILCAYSTTYVIVWNISQLTPFKSKLLYVSTEVLGVSLLHWLHICHISSRTSFFF